MNPYKQQKSEFLKNYFNYPEQLKKAILSSDAYSLYSQPLADCKINSVKYLKNTNELVRILDKCEFYIHYFWKYRYQSTIRIVDWVGLFWTDSGLYIHFEWMRTYRAAFYDDVEMTNAMWEFFYVQRRKILNNFYPELTLSFVNDEDFGMQLTDHNLARIIK